MNKDIKKSIFKIILCTSIFVMIFTTLVFAEIKVTEIEVKGDYDFIDSFSEGLAVVSKDSKYGYINKEGEEVIPCIYDYASEFSEGLAKIGKGEWEYRKYGYVNKEGKEIIPCIYDEATSFFMGIAKVEKEGKTFYIDKAGNEINLNNNNETFSEGLAIIRKGEYPNYKYGYINEEEEEVIPCIYDHAEKFSEGLAIVGKSEYPNKKYGYINKKGEEVIPYIYDLAFDFSEGLAAVKKNGKWGYINAKGKEVIPCIYDDAKDFWEGKAIVKKDEKYGCVNKIGEEIVPCIYNTVLYLSKDLMRVRRENKWGIVNLQGEEVVPCIYDNIGNFKEGLALVNKGVNSNCRYGYINIKGEEIVSCDYINPLSFSEGLASALKGDFGNRKYGYINSKGEEVIPHIYDYASNVKDGLATAKKEGKWYILKIENDEPWNVVSSWAENELKEVAKKELIPGILKYTDLTKEITREEFAATVVRMYEELTGTETEIGENPFIDTENEEVLKAYNLGITNGISEDEFAPNELITREQMATMMTRALSKAGINTKVENVKKFADDEDISDWAKESVYYMSNIEIIKGMGENKFAAKEKASREQALLISIRSINKLSK